MSTPNPFYFSDGRPRPGTRLTNLHAMGVEAFGTGAPVASHPDDPKGLSTTARRDIAAARRILATHGLDVRVQRKAPTFQPGDVLVVRFHGPHSTPYTYVRSRRDWPGDGVRKTDAEMADLWREGKAVLIARDGQHYSDAASPAAQARGGLL